MEFCNVCFVLDFISIAECSLVLARGVRLGKKGTYTISIRRGIKHIKSPMGAL